MIDLINELTSSLLNERLHICSARVRWLGVQGDMDLAITFASHVAVAEFQLVDVQILMVPNDIEQWNTE
jgi:hypothetical protein